MNYSLIIVIICIVLFSGCINYNTTNTNDKNNFEIQLNNTINKIKVIGNFHTQTDCSDGENTYNEMINEAIKLKFDFIAITDHEMCNNYKQLCNNEKRILCIYGQEVSTYNGHILGIDINNEISDQLSIEEIIYEIHKQNGIAIAAHPLRSDGIKEEKLKLFDAIECNHPDYDEKEIEQSKIIAQKYNLNCTYDSDAHSKEALKNIYNICYVSEKDINNLKLAILNNNCKEYKTI